MMPAKRHWRLRTPSGILARKIKQMAIYLMPYIASMPNGVRNLQWRLAVHAT